MLRVRVLGELVIEGSDGPVELSGSWRARSLLAWLAVHPGTHLRSRIAPLFWPDVLDESARASLRNALWSIRRALGTDADALDATRERVGLAPHGEGLWLDLAAFEELAAAGRLVEAYELRRGELVADIEDDWAFEERDRFRERVARLLTALATASEDEGDDAAAIRWTREAIRMEPLDEEAHRALIARLLAAGDRAGALAAFGRLRQRLRRDLGIAPSGETRRLVLDIQDEDPALSADAGVAAAETEPDDVPGWSPGTPFPLPRRFRHPPATSFVGRGRELGTLRRAWRAVAAGDGARLAAISGEPGIGKSRLMREVALAAHDEGAIVLHGSSTEDLLVPHQHLVEALGQLRTALSPELEQRRFRPRATALAPLLLDGPVPEPTDEQARQGEDRRYLLYEAVAALLAEASDDAPALLCVDDLQWADDSTAGIVRHALRSRPDARLLVLATVRTGEASDSVGEALRRLLGEPFAEEIRLGAMADAEVDLLAEEAGARRLGAELRAAVRTESHGNPFFAQEIARHLAAEGDGASVLALERGEVPKRIRDVIDLRLARLSDSCLGALRVGAVVGPAFEFAILERVSNLAGEELAAVLAEAVAADLLIEDAGGSHGERFSFPHSLLRRTLHARLSGAQLRRIHLRVGEALLEARGDKALIEVADHLCAAQPVGDTERALEYAVRAAEWSAERLAFAEAVEFYTRARGMLPPEDERRRTLALRRGVAYQALFHSVMDAPSRARRPS